MQGKGREEQGKEREEGRETKSVSLVSVFPCSLVLNGTLILSVHHLAVTSSTPPLVESTASVVALSYTHLSLAQAKG